MKEEMNRQAEGQPDNPMNRHFADLDEEDLSLAALLAPLAARKWLALTIGLVSIVMATAVAFLLPATYTATALVMLPPKDQPSSAMMLSQLGPLAAAAGADLGLKNPAEMYVGLLGSRTIADRLIEKFGLQKLYRKKTQTDTRKKLKNRTEFTTGRDSLIRIAVDDVDPNRAAGMANAYVAELDRIDKRLAITEAGQRRLFLERQLADERNALAEAEDSMKSLQQKTGLIEVTGQTQLAIASAAELRAQITAGEVMLERLKMGATVENPSVVQAQAELSAMRSELKKLETGQDGGPLVPTATMPETGLSYIRRLRDLKYHEFLFELLSKQYEAARLDESKAAPSIQVVDAAVPPDKRSGPFRSLIVLAGGLTGAVAAIFASRLAVRRSARNAQPSSLAGARR